jgi:hypothetical protein
MKKSLVITVAVAALAACNEAADEMPMGPDQDALTAELGFAPGGAARYRVTVYNLSEGQPFTPPLAATHRQPISMFQVGSPASYEIQQIAENGNLTPMSDLLGSSDHVFDVVTAGGDPPPVLPGQSRSFYIDSAAGAKWLSLASMLICTNDGFTGLDSQRLPKQVGESVSVYADGYDAGTEINTEAWSDLVPPCAVITGFGDQGGTGASNPALAEDGVIRRHPNVQGTGDLQIDPHRWAEPVAKFEIERVQ